VPAWLRHHLWSGLFIAVYVALDGLSFIHPFGNLPLTPWNPHAGLAMAWLILSGSRKWLVVALAHSIASFHTSGAFLDLTSIVLVALAYGGIYGMAAAKLRRYGGSRPWHGDVSHFGRFLLVSAVSSLSVSIVLCLVFGFTAHLAWPDMGAALLRGWVGDLIGMLLFVPLLTRVDWRSLPPLRPTAEQMMQFMTMLAACGVVFGLDITDEFKFFYLLFPPMLWAAVRGGTMPCLLTLTLTQLCLMVAVVWRDVGDEKTLALQVLMLVLVATGLLVSGQTEARQQAETALRDRLGELARLGRIHSAAEIATGLAHELKQPMLAVLNYVGAAIRLLERTPPEIQDATSIMRKADLQVGRADAILRRMRNYVQKGEPRVSSIDVAGIVREAVDLVTPMLRRHDIRVDSPGLERLPPLLADPIQVLQVLVNLLSNAVHAITEHAITEHAITEHGGSNGTVTVTARRVAANRVEIAVSDNGPGLAADILDALYQPFVTARADGMGLGLAISRSIAEAHGGSLRHDPPQPGTGATFRVVLPCAEVHDEP